jgi:hypothetical protein
MRPVERCYTRTDPVDTLLSYVLDYSIYDQKFANYVEVFGREPILVIPNDELRTEPRSTMRRVFEHCRLEWVDSEFFGAEDYVSGSRKIRLAPEVEQRLAELFYPSYRRFCQQAGIRFKTRSVI